MAIVGLFLRVTFLLLTGIRKIMKEFFTMLIGVMEETIIVFVGWIELRKYKMVTHLTTILIIALLLVFRQLIA